MDLRIKAIEQETHDTVTLRLVNNDENKRSFDYHPGQYLTFRFDDLAPKPLVRSYTMSSSPSEEDDLALTVKDVGLVSKYLVRQTQVGDILRARGPIGKFGFDPETDHPHLVMIAAGSGVTPFISIMRQNLGQLRCSLLVVYRSQKDVICAKELDLFSKTPGMSVMRAFTREQVPGHEHGRYRKELLVKLVGSNFAGATFMTCGPESMMQQVKVDLLSSEVEPSHIKMESFA
jgi:ferredoxin-NADP reductase